MSYGYLITAILVLTFVPFLVIQYANFDDSIATDYTFKPPSEMINVFHQEGINNPSQDPAYTSCVSAFGEDISYGGIVGSYWTTTDDGFFKKIWNVFTTNFDNSDCLYTLFNYDVESGVNSVLFPFSNNDGLMARVASFLEAVIDYTIGLFAWLLDNFVTANVILIQEFHLNPIIPLGFFGVWVVILVFSILEVIPFT